MATLYGNGRPNDSSLSLEQRQFNFDNGINPDTGQPWAAGIGEAGNDDPSARRPSKEGGFLDRLVPIAAGGLATAGLGGFLGAGASGLGGGALAGAEDAILSPALGGGIGGGASAGLGGAAATAGGAASGGGLMSGVGNFFGSLSPTSIAGILGSAGSGIASAIGANSAAKSQADAAKHAADTQAAAGKYATDAQTNMFNAINGQQAPWRQAGSNALGAIAGGFGLGPASGGVSSNQFTHQFNADDLKKGLAPNYDFQLQQGLGALNNQASVGGGLLSGNALKGVNDYAQNTAKGAYQQAFDNYNANQTNIFNRLSNIAGLGTTANGQTAQAGTSTANSIGNIATNIAGNIGSAQLAGGAANAAGNRGIGNSISNAINDATGWYMGNQKTAPGSSIPISAINAANRTDDPIAALNASQGWGR